MTATLHPGGTLRARFEPVASDVFRRLGIGARRCDLGDQGLYLAEELVAADAGWLGSGDHPEALAILVLALVLAQRQGSTRLPLDPRGPLRALVADIARLAGAALDVPRVLRTITNLTATPRFNSVIGTGDARLPLVVDLGALYTERARWLEHRVAGRLAARLVATPARAGDPAAIATALADDGGLSDEQRAAVERALAGALTVITGGPGTGKTRIAAAIVRGLARQGVTEIALAAQTGKAANRLTEVIADQLARVAARSPVDERSESARGGDTGGAGPRGIDERSESARGGDPAGSAGGAGAGPRGIDAALASAPPAAQTLHRLLGYRGGRFTHHAHSPLPVGAVLIDEASMLDLELVDALLDALPAAAPLILIGDADQLPAIDAGQILADLTAGATDPRIAGRVAVLTRSYRQDPADVDGRAIFAAARAIHAGDAARLVDKKQPLAAPRAPTRLTFRGVEWVETDAPLAVAEALWHHHDGPRALRAGERVFRFEGGVVDPAQRAELEALWQLLGRARVLTVTRALPTGALAINAALHELALDRLSVSGRPEFVPGEPIMMTANDHARGLYNGDQGIVVRADEGLGRHHYRAVFRCGGELRPFAIEALRDRLELAWALTIHKSQGSELDAVAVVLPADDLPLVTRELLYTAVTRARTGVVLAGPRAVLLAGGKRRALRHSGLVDRVRATLDA